MQLVHKPNLRALSKETVDAVATGPARLWPTIDGKAPSVLDEVEAVCPNKGDAEDSTALCMLRRRETTNCVPSAVCGVEKLVVAHLLHWANGVTVNSLLDCRLRLRRKDNDFKQGCFCSGT